MPRWLSWKERPLLLLATIFLLLLLFFYYFLFPYTRRTFDYKNDIFSLALETGDTVLYLPRRNINCHQESQGSVTCQADLGNKILETTLTYNNSTEYAYNRHINCAATYNHQSIECQGSFKRIPSQPGPKPHVTVLKSIEVGYSTEIKMIFETYLLSIVESEENVLINNLTLYSISIGVGFIVIKLIGLQQKEQLTYPRLAYTVLVGIISSVVCAVSSVGFLTFMKLIQW